MRSLNTALPPISKSSYIYPVSAVNATPEQINKIVGQLKKIFLKKALDTVKVIHGELTRILMEIKQKKNRKSDQFR